LELGAFELLAEAWVIAAFSADGAGVTAEIAGGGGYPATVGDDGDELAAFGVVEEARAAGTRSVRVQGSGFRVQGVRRVRCLVVHERGRCESEE